MTTSTDFSADEVAALQGLFGSLNYDRIGADALERCLIVFPWTLRYFGSFGNLYNAEAILGNAKIAAHGVVVTKGLTLGLDNINNLKDAYAALGKKHANEILVDPDNFRLFSDCLTIEVARSMGNKFTCDLQATFQKYLYAVTDAMKAQYK